MSQSERLGQPGAAGVMVVDASGVVRSVNPAAAALLGQSENELLNRPTYLPLVDGTYVDVDGDAAAGRPCRLRVNVRVAAIEWEGAPANLLWLEEATPEETAQALRQQAERIRLLHEIDRAVLAAKSPADIAQVAVQRIREIVACERAAVVVFDQATGFAERLAVDTVRETRLRVGMRVPLADYGVPEPNWHGQIYFASDLTALADPSPLDRALSAEGLESYLSVPLMSDGRLIGVLNLARGCPSAFSREEVEVARQVADSLAIAIQNAQLYQRERAGREQLQSLSRRLVEVQEAERRSIAQELHDEAGQALTSMMVGLGLLEREISPNGEAAARIDELKRTASGVLEGLRRLAANLRPAALDHLGLVPALRQHIETFGTQNGLAVEFAESGLDAIRLSREAELTLYRVVQEALTNVVRHAEATRASVLLERRDDQALAIIEDNGVGFDPEAAMRRGRLGLFGMRERAELLGGSLLVESAPGTGTTVFVEVPAEPA